MNWASAEAALAFAQGEVGGDQWGQAQGTVSAGNAQDPGMGAGGLVQRPRVQDEGRLVQQRQASRHGVDYRKSIAVVNKNPLPAAPFSNIQN